MRKYFFIIPAVILIFNFTLVYPMSGKQAFVPLKPSSNLSINDGEFLHYKQTIGGEKNKDIFFVTRIITNRGMSALIYQQGIILTNNEQLPLYYTNFKVHYTVSMKEGSLEESEGTYSTNRNKDREPSTFNEMFYWHYLVNTEDHVFEAENKLWDGYEVKSRKDKINLKPGYPVWDMISGSFFGPRFMDISRPGILFYVMPELLKEPLPVYYRIIGKEKIKSNAGTFNTIKITLMAADPFLSKLMDSISKDTFFWIEDSDRKLIVKFQSMGFSLLLDEISNVNNQISISGH